MQCEHKNLYHRHNTSDPSIYW